MSGPKSSRHQGTGYKSKGKNVNLRVRVVDQYERTTEYQEQDGYYANGENDDYPQLVDSSILNSPTGIKASGLFAKYIAGSGIIGEDMIVDKKEGTKLSELRHHIAKDIATQYGSFIHRSLRLNLEDGKVTFETDQTKRLPFQNCRIGRKDSQDNLGKIYVGEFGKQQASKFTYNQDKKEENKWYYPFNNDPKVIKAQIRRDAELYIQEWNKNNKNKKKSLEDLDLKDMIRHYRGQVLYENLTPEFVYPVSRFDPVINDMDTEFRVGVFTNRQLRSGFLGKLMLLINSTEGEEGQSLADQAESWLGIENSGDIVIVEMDERIEEMESLIHQVKLQREYNEEQFKDTPERLRKTILGAANNAPEPLVFAGEGSAMFGNSGEQLIEMQKFYQQQTEQEREYLEKILRRLGYNVGIAPILQEDDQDTEDENRKAQASLRGSLAGVQGILALQASVTRGDTTLSAAQSTLVHIYGFDKETASQIIGNPGVTGPKTGAAQ